MTHRLIDEIPLLRERAAAFRFVVETVAVCHLSWFPPGKRGSLVQTLDLIIIAMEILVGHADGDYVRASALGKRLGIPRMTLMRKLARLVKLGLIERRDGGYAFNMTMLDTRAKLGMEMRRLIKRASDELAARDKSAEDEDKFNQ
jgi:DNA-binding MarR family transcriptional regulator